MNVSSFDAFVQSIRTALAGFGTERFDYLVNNAETSHHDSIEKTTEEELDSLYDVHFKGVFFLTQKLLPLINDGGRIVNVSSGLTRITLPGSAPYASMKGAVEVLTLYLAKEPLASYLRNCQITDLLRHSQQRKNNDASRCVDKIRRPLFIQP